MTETLFAVVNADGVVENVIVADQAFIDGLTEQMSDPSVDTGALSGDHSFYDVTDKDPRPSVGWVRRNRKFIEPDPTPEEIAAREAAELAAQQAADDATFRTAMQDKLRSGESLTQDERDRLLALS